MLVHCADHFGMYAVCPDDDDDLNEINENIINIEALALAITV